MTVKEIVYADFETTLTKLPAIHRYTEIILRKETFLVTTRSSS